MWEFHVISCDEVLRNLVGLNLVGMWNLLYLAVAFKVVLAVFEMPQKLCRFPPAIYVSRVCVGCIFMNRVCFLGPGVLV